MRHFIYTTKKYIDALFHLFVPYQCVICSVELTEQESILCSCCQSELPFTYYEKISEPSALDKLFWGRVQLHATYSLLFYQKQTFIKNILFDLKYNYRPDIGIQFGQLLGDKLEEMRNFESVDVILPVPLHPKKMKKRGYNQAYMLAKGIHKQLNIPINEKILQRVQHNESQTKMSRFNRWENIKESFDVTALISNYNHILLVDDVITTGATLEAIIQQIHQKAPSIKISVASLALAKR